MREGATGCHCSVERVESRGRIVQTLNLVSKRSLSLVGSCGEVNGKCAGNKQFARCLRA